MDELVKDLRENHDKYFARDMQAADAIEQLGKDLERSKEWEGFWKEQAEEAKGKLQQYALAVANKPRWIPVEERLPEYGERVLVFGGVTMYVAYYDKNRYGGESWHKLNSKSHICNPTHWMPIPPAPKEET